MKKYLLLLSWVCGAWAGYNHPGQGSFLEAGYANGHAPYGYEVDVPYGVPKLVLGDFTWEGFRANWDIVDLGAIKIGPMAGYTFSPYAGDELAKLAGMNRTGFFEYGALGTISLPFGQLFLHCGKAPEGMIYKVALGTGLPLMPLNGNHIWLNILLEYGYYDSGVASYMFGVQKSEEIAGRAGYAFSDLTYFSSILGLWTPLGGNWWFNVTYKFDNFNNKILKSPIVERDWDGVLMVGLMYSFGK